MKKIIALSCLVIVGTSCGSKDTADSADVNEDKIYERYAVYFDSETNETWIRAQFRLAGSTGTTLRLTSPSDVKADGSVMDLQDGDEAILNISGTYYSKTLKNQTSVPTSVVFVYTRGDAKVHTNTVKMPKAASITLSTANVTKGQAFSVTYTGDAPVTDENVNCYLLSSGTSSDENVKTSASGNYSASTNLCTFDATETTGLLSGAAKVYLIKSISSSALAEGNEGVGGSTYGQFQSAKVDVNVMSSQ